MAASEHFGIVVNVLMESLAISPEGINEDCLLRSLGMDDYNECIAILFLLDRDYGIVRRKSEKWEREFRKLRTVADLCRYVEIRKRLDRIREHSKSEALPC